MAPMAHLGPLGRVALPVLQVLLGRAVLADGAAHGGEGFGLSDQVEQDVAVVGEDVSDHARVAAGDLLRMVDVIVDVEGDEFPELAVVEEGFCPLEPGFVNVIVTGHEDDADALCGIAEGFEFGD